MAEPKAVSTKLSKEIFEVEVKDYNLLKLAYNSNLAKVRSASPRTKTRGLVSGGGKKPWKQKGTGRARVGSSRSPIWRTGGIIFGPTGNENHTLKVNYKAKRLAIKQALSLKNVEKKIEIISDIKLKQDKTSELAKLLSISGKQQRTLLVIEKTDAVVSRCGRNINSLKIVSARYLSVNAVLDADRVLITKSALGVIETWLSLKEGK